jgi:signal transduction histidine kinase
VSPVAVVGFFPLCAVASSVAFTALRLGRAVGRGLVALCFCLALWAAGLILAVNPSTEGWASRLIPGGMLLAGGFAHAFSDVARLDARREVFAAWSFGLVVSLLGVFAPASLYLPATNATGPLFWPLAVVSTVATLAVHGWMLKHTLAVQGFERSRRGALLLANILGALGGGGIIVLRVAGVAPMATAAPLLLGSVLLAAWSVLAEERGRHRELVSQGLWSAVVTAALSAVGLTVFYAWLPSLLPTSGNVWAWAAWVIFLAALPLDPVRQLLVEGLGRRLFQRPMAVSALTQELEASERRALHAEQLAELGKLASVVAHEVRNPLGVILAQAKLLEREGAAPERVKDVRAQVARANGFVEELLRYAKPRALTLGTVDVASAVQTAIERVAQAQGAKCLTSMVSPASLEADAEAFIDSLVIVLSNAAIAVESQPEGQVRVRSEARGERLALIVEDNGPGVPEALAPRLFTMFVTGRGRDHAHPGTGLGLAIAAQHLRRHGGAIHYEPNTPVGARFTLEWPRHPSVFG